GRSGGWRWTWRASSIGSTFAKASSLSDCRASPSVAALPSTAASGLAVDAEVVEPRARWVVEHREEAGSAIMHQDKSHLPGIVPFPMSFAKGIYKYPFSAGSGDAEVLSLVALKSGQDCLGGRAPIVADLLPLALCDALQIGPELALEPRDLFRR